MVPRLAAVFLLVAGLAPPAFADPDPKDPIPAAIRGGQNYLKAIYGPGGGAGRPGGPPPPPVAGAFGGVDGGGALPFVGGNGFGSATLAGLALLESGVPATDPAVANLERGLRASAFGTKATYELSLLIMFFDRLGRKEDTPMIQFLTLRLMGGQLRDGTWGYSCDGLALDAVTERQLQAELSKDARLVSPPTAKAPRKEKDPGKPRTDLDPPPAKKGDPKPKPEPEPKKEEPKGLHPLLEKMIVQFGRGGSPSLAIGDHSNTQFATVGLWVGRRHSVNVAPALTAIDQHYRQTQGSDGGWGYTGSGGASGPSMTCAGLMGLAMGHGAKTLTDGGGRAAKGADGDAIGKDKAVDAGLQYVGNVLAAAAAQPDPRGGPVSGFAAHDLGSNLYFLWSLERVGMVYGLTTIGKVDWYDWGSRTLVATQQRDGSWTSTSHGTADNATSFALLFLSRANLAQDLSASLRGKVRDPGTSRLVTGGDLADILGKAGTGSGSPARPEVGTPKPKTPGPTPPKAVAPTPPPVLPTLDNAGKLAAALVAAGPADRPALLEKYRDTKGADYTDALARALAELSGDAQAAPREALAARLTRMTPATLTGFMKDRNRELRRAAALACAAKGKDRIKEFGEDLIKLIGDDDPLVVQAARASLKELSGQDHGPDSAATAAGRGRALIAWQKWWAGQK